MHVSQTTDFWNVSGRHFVCMVMVAGELDRRGHSMTDVLYDRRHMNPVTLADIWSEESVKALAQADIAMSNGDLIAAQRHQSTADTLARCAKAVAAAVEWQDISTAPRNGTSILAYLPMYDNMLVLKFKDGCWREPYSDYAYRQSPPTLWLPLPAVPVNK